MSANGGPDTKPPVADLEDPAFDSLATPYQLAALRHATIIQMNAMNRLADRLDVLAASQMRLFDRIESWEKTFQERAHIMVDSAAEETAARFSVRVLREIGGVTNRVEKLEVKVGLAESRASNAELLAAKAEGKADASGQWAASAAKTPVLVAKESDPPVPGVPKKYRKLVMILIGVVAAIGAAVEALK